MISPLPVAMIPPFCQSLQVVRRGVPPPRAGIGPSPGSSGDPCTRLPRASGDRPLKLPSSTVCRSVAPRIYAGATQQGDRRARAQPPAHAPHQVSINGDDESHHHPSGDHPTHAHASRDDGDTPSGSTHRRRPPAPEGSKRGLEPPLAPAGRPPAEAAGCSKPAVAHKPAAAGCNTPGPAHTPARWKSRCPPAAH